MRALTGWMLAVVCCLGFAASPSWAQDEPAPDDAKPALAFAVKTHAALYVPRPVQDDSDERVRPRFIRLGLAGGGRAIVKDHKIHLTFGQLNAPRDQAKHYATLELPKVAPVSKSGHFRMKGTAEIHLGERVVEVPIHLSGRIHPSRPIKKGEDGQVVRRLVIDGIWLGRSARPDAEAEEGDGEAGRPPVIVRGRFKGHRVRINPEPSDEG